MTGASRVLVGLSNYLSSRTEYGPAHLGVVDGFGACFVWADDVVLPDGPLHPDLSFGHERPEGTVGLVQLADGPVVHGDRQLGSRDLNQLRPSGGGGHVCYRDEGDDLAQLFLEELIRIQCAVRSGPCRR